MSLLTRRNILLAIAIGIGSGYYSFSVPLAQYHSKQHTKEDVKKNKITNEK